MHAERRPGSSGTKTEPARRRRPRVVIFDLAGQAQVEVLDLPEDAKLGHQICHSGRNWRVTGMRTGTRVLIAEPDAN